MMPGIFGYAAPERVSKIQDDFAKYLCTLLSTLQLHLFATKAAHKYPRDVPHTENAFQSPSELRECLPGGVQGHG